MRQLLDTIYRGSAYAAAFCLFAIFVLVSIQVLARLADAAMRLAGLTPLGFIVPSIAEICGYLLAAASFMALSYTLTVGGHIRVGLLVDRLPPSPRRAVETAVGIVGAGIAGYATLAMARLAIKSWTFNDVSYGFVPLPLWLPQALMALGLLLLVVALLDTTLSIARRGGVQPGRSEV